MPFGEWLYMQAQSHTSNSMKPKARRFFCFVLCVKREYENYVLWERWEERQDLPTSRHCTGMERT